MVTSGQSSWIWSSASPADATGAMTTMPATRWSRCLSTTALIDARSTLFTVPTFTTKPAAVAARSSAVSRDAGPKRLLYRATTPISRVRPVTSARAARFGR